jgi:hypothetical protein
MKAELLKSKKQRTKPSLVSVCWYTLFLVVVGYYAIPFLFQVNIYPLQKLTMFSSDPKLLKVADRLILLPLPMDEYEQEQALNLAQRKGIAAASQIYPITYGAFRLVRTQIKGDTWDYDTLRP